MFCKDFGQFISQSSSLGDAGQVAFDIGHEDRHADAGKALSQGLQGDGFARAGGTGDEAMAVGFVRKQETLGFAALGNQDRFRHGALEKYNQTYSVTNF